eukprot:m.1236964 g.1236964  ORF g.1236964 m.1236964 type:complete len:254 (+) comp24667_c1_seq23:154-915(+)
MHLTRGARVAPGCGQGLPTGTAAQQRVPCVVATQGTLQRISGCSVAASGHAPPKGKGSEVVSVCAGVWKTMTAAAHESSTDSAHMTNSFAHMTDVVGTLAWMAPEVVRCRRDLMARPAVDVYAFGIVLWELVTRSLPWDDAVRYPDAASIQAAIVGHERPEYDGSDPQGVRMYAMARTCWVDDPRARPSFVTLGDQVGFCPPVHFSKCAGRLRPRLCLCMCRLCCGGHASCVSVSATVLCNGVGMLGIVRVRT